MKDVNIDDQIKKQKNIIKHLKQEQLDKQKQLKRHNGLKLLNHYYVIFKDIYKIHHGTTSVYAPYWSNEPSGYKYEFYPNMFIFYNDSTTYKGFYFPTRQFIWSKILSPRSDDYYAFLFTKKQAHHFCNLSKYPKLLEAHVMPAKEAIPNKFLHSLTSNLLSFDKMHHPKFIKLIFGTTHISA